MDKVGYYNISSANATIDIMFPNITFLSPTPFDSEFIDKGHFIANISITEDNLEIVRWEWDSRNYTIFDDYTNCVMNKNLTDGIQILYSLHDEGYSVMDILDNYFLYIKLTNLLNDNIKYKLTTLVCKYIIYFHNVHEDELELALFTNNFVQLF